MDPKTMPVFGVIAFCSTLTATVPLSVGNCQTRGRHSRKGQDAWGWLGAGGWGIDLNLRQESYILGWL